MFVITDLIRSPLMDGQRSYHGLPVVCSRHHSAQTSPVTTQLIILPQVRTLHTTVRQSVRKPYYYSTLQSSLLYLLIAYTYLCLVY